MDGILILAAIAIICLTIIGVVGIIQIGKDN